MGTLEGPVASYTWVPPGVAPRLIGWGLLLVLLLLRKNRTGSAWWIWAPVVAGFGMGLAAKAAENVFPRGVGDPLSQVFTALVFGLAALWLLLHGLAWRNRFLGLLAMVVIVALTAGATGAANLDFESQWYELGGILVAVGIGSALIALALTLTGLLCRRRYGVIRVLLWLSVVLLLSTMLLLAPFAVFAVMVGGGGPGWGEFLVAALVIAGALVTAVLPFLILAFVNSLYRERLKGLLHLGDEPAPPMIASQPLETATVSH